MFFGNYNKVPRRIDETGVRADCRLRSRSRDPRRDNELDTQRACAHRRPLRIRSHRRVVIRERSPESVIFR